MKDITMKVWSLLLITTAFSLVGYSNEYFVSVTGDDAHDGLGRATAFASVQHGIDVLEAGDSLTVLPGEYRGSVYRDGLGSAEADTVIRAEIPGTVLIRGDEWVGAFERVEGYRFVYATDFVSDGQVTAINEWDSEVVLDASPTIGLLEFTPGSFYYDGDAARLYISTPDLKEPTGRRYSASVRHGTRPGHGIELVNARRVVLEGLAVMGFNANQLYPWQARSMGAVWGILLAGGSDCVIRNCRVFMNSRGICINSFSDESGDNVIEDCVAWSNSGQYDNGDTGGLTLIGPRRDIIRDSVAFNNGNYGVNMYGRSGTEGEDEKYKSFMLRNLAWGNGTADMKIKTGRTYMHRADYNIGLGLWSLQRPGLHNPDHSLMGRYTDECNATNIPLNQMEPFDLAVEFADPDNMDFRLQASSRFRGAGPDGVDQGPFPYEPTVFYVSPEGDDSADGLSVSSAWRTLARAAVDLSGGDTLYLLPGRYTGDVRLTVSGSDDALVYIRGRGRDAVVIVDAVQVADSAVVRFERLIFESPVNVSGGEDIAFHNCVFGDHSGLRADETGGLAVTHCEFSGQPIEVQHSAVAMLSGNLFQQRAAAVHIDADSEVRYSDYNGYAQPAIAWQRAGRSLTLAEVQQQHDRHSVTVADRSAASKHWAPAASMRTAGPYRSPVGVCEPWAREQAGLKAVGPVLHSVSATTANFEWWVSGPSDVIVRWGKVGTTDAQEQIEMLTSRWGGFSLTGLEPGTDYWFAVEFDEPVTALQGAGEEGLAGQLSRTFTTAAADKPSVEYYVAPDGDDRNNGLRREAPFRTVTRAAEVVMPGDTVWIAGGTYHESVYIRASGEAGRPITFRSIPGEKVVFDGDDRMLSFAFLASNKHHLRFDGFYFKMIGFGSDNLPWSDHMLSRGNGAFVLYRSDNVTISRCFIDGRGLGYSPGLVHVWDCADFALENSVIIRAMGGAVNFSGSPNLHLRHNVFFQPLISAIGEAMNPPDMRFVMENNIFTDSIGKKVAVSLFGIGKVESMVENNNCYFLRIADDERRMFSFYGTTAYERAAAAYRLPTEFEAQPVFDEITRLSLADHMEQFNSDSTSIVADPEFVGGLDIDPVDADGNPVYVVDLLLRVPELDFADFFATNPELVERGIGLQLDAFIDAGRVDLLHE